MGSVEHVHLAAAAGQPVVAVASVRAVPGVGLEGDRYATAAGTWSETPGTGRDLTLVEAEELVEFGRTNSFTVEPGEMRRNVTTRGVRLNELVGREFHVGSVRCRGERLCEPCDYLQGVTGKPVLQGLVHRAGLRATILSAGTISVGDEITAVTD